MKREFLSAAEFDRRFRRGGVHVAPGIWIDCDGGLHYSVPELLALVGLDNTPENAAAVLDMIREMIEREAPDAELIRIDDIKDRPQ